MASLSAAGASRRLPLPRARRLRSPPRKVKLLKRSRLSASPSTARLSLLSKSNLRPAACTPLSHLVPASPAAAMDMFSRGRSLPSTSESSTSKSVSVMILAGKHSVKAKKVHGDLACRLYGKEFT